MTFHVEFKYTRYNETYNTCLCVVHKHCRGYEKLLEIHDKIITLQYYRPIRHIPGTDICTIQLIVPYKERKQLDKNQFYQSDIVLLKKTKNHKCYINLLSKNLNPIVNRHREVISVDKL